MARKVGKDLTKTCSAQMLIDNAHKENRRAFTLTELIVVVLIIALFVLLAVSSISSLFLKSMFKAQAQQLTSTMQMAVNAAAENNGRYEVIIDLTEQSYTLRMINSPDISETFEEDIIAKNSLNDNCQIAYVVFDDLMETDQQHQIAKFRAGHSGWQYGGKIVLLDKNGRPYSVVVNRLNRIVALQEGDVGILLPKTKDEMVF